MILSLINRYQFIVINLTLMGYEQVLLSFKIVVH